MSLDYSRSLYYVRRSRLGRSSLSRMLPADVLRRGDPILLAAVLVLCIVGALLVWSATRSNEQITGTSSGLFPRHLLNIAIGLVLGTAVALLPHRLLRPYAPAAYGIAIVGLLLVLTPLGVTRNGSHSWIALGDLSIQPAEFAKVALVVGCAVLLAERAGGSSDGPNPRARAVFAVLGLAAVPAALVLLQPDAGTVLVLGCIVFGMIVASGASWRWLTGLVLAVVLAGVAVTQLGLLEQHQLDRFSAFANPDLDPRGVGYNTAQARIAVGSGGFFGDGLFQGQQTAGQFVPEQESDFIFTVAGEELGFAGSTVIIALLGVVLWRAIHIALNADDMFGTLVATGVVCWFGFQAFQNIGMTIGIVPVTGLPLPFVSYGGTAMFASLIAVGLLQNIQLRRT